MKKKGNVAKLRLNKETVAALQTHQTLRRVAGGVSDSDCYTLCSECCDTVWQGCFKTTTN